MPGRISLRTIVIGGVIVGLLIPMSIGTLYSLKTQRERLYQEANATHQRATNVLSLGVSKALWDLSPEGAIPLVKSMMDDDRIVSAQVFDSQGNIFHEETSTSRPSGTIVSLEKPVMNEADTIGKVKVDFSMASAEAQIQSKMIEAIALSTIQALVCILILVLLINRRLLKPINILKDQANLIAKKSLDTPFDWQANDEIGELGSSLEITRTALRELFAELEAKNLDLANINGNLEKIVAERTATIKMILDHVRSGFLVVDKSLTIFEGYTKSCETLLGTRELTGQSLVSKLRIDEQKARYFHACIEQLFDDFMPEQISLDQIPRRFKIGENSISLEGSTIRDAAGNIDKILFTIVDVTELEHIEAENRANRAMVRIMQNITSFRDFVVEFNDRLLDAQKAIDSGNEPIVRRELHTLKGNSAAFGLDAISSLIHRIEDQALITIESINTVENSFARFLDNNYELLKLRFGQNPEPTYVVSHGELDNLKAEIFGNHNAETIRNIAFKWMTNVQKSSVLEVLGPVEGYIQKLAGELGRSINFEVRGGSLKVDRDEVKDVVQNLIHLLRNAIDHGIEPESEREGKSQVAHLILSFEEARDGSLIIEVEDDGRGIDKNKVLERTLAMGKISESDAKTMSDEDIYSLIFLDGLSTASTVSDISGRGVGMRAILDAIEAKNGSIKINSKRGRGTKFVITLPCHHRVDMHVAA